MASLFHSPRSRSIVFSGTLVAVVALFAVRSAELVTTNWNAYNRTSFLDEALVYVGTLSVVLFFVLIHAAKVTQLRKSKAVLVEAISPQNGVVRGWGIGILFAASLIAGLNFYVNPRGQYSTRNFVPRVNPSRIVKPIAFLELPQPPDLVVMGSSRAFTIQPGYIQQTLGLTAFNFSVESGKVNDALIQARFMEAQHRFPQVILYEGQVGLQSGTSYTAQFSSSHFLPYMSSQMAYEFIRERIVGLFGVQQLAESFYILQYAREIPLDPGWQFGPDGGGNNPFLLNPQAAIEQRLADGISTCPRVTEEGLGDTEELLQITQRHSTAVIFYLPPLPAEVYESITRENRRYLQCAAQLMDYIERLQREYPLVFFLDFSDATMFEGLTTEEGFLDGVHMTITGNSRVIDAAAGTILEAYQQAQASNQIANNDASP